MPKPRLTKAACARLQGVKVVAIDALETENRSKIAAIVEFANCRRSSYDFIEMQ